jgi:hypothetical protein
MHWPTPMFNKASEIFAHNQIEINAPLATVWNHLVQAEQWPSWCPYSRRVTIWGASKELQKNSKFTWWAYDLPQDNLPFFPNLSDRQDSLVVEYVPLRRIGWRTFGRDWGPPWFSLCLLSELAAKASWRQKMSRHLRRSCHWYGGSLGPRSLS